ncbi:UNVERIFIED_CONTAM: putative nucleotidyltransferase with HDIG domain [Acetivibrio alkalicellulosi]
MRLNQKNTRKEFKMLLLDDDNQYVKNKVAVLKGYGYDVEGETSASKALEKLKTSEYDLLLLDYLMDEMRGDKVVEEIRKFNKELFILLLTGYAQSPPLEIMEQLDVSSYCEKSTNNTQLLILIKSAQRSAQMMSTIKSTRDGLNKIISAVPNIYKLSSLDHLIKDLLDEIINVFETKDAFILIDNIEDEEIKLTNGTIFKGTGKYQELNDIDYELMESMGTVRTKNSLFIINENVFLPIKLHKFPTIGVLYFKTTKKLNEESLKLLNIFKSLISSSINNSLLHSIINIKKEELRKSREDLAVWYIEAVSTIRLTIDAKDNYTCSHSDRVSDYAVKIGTALNLPQNDIELLRDGGIFHDIGKIGTEDKILKKTGKLDFDEYNEIKKHTIRGALILSAVSMFSSVVPLVRHHHEKYDGTGYPDGLKGEEIPFLARILSVADAFDAMTTDRTYQNKKSVHIAIEELKKGAGTQFDPEIVDLTIDLINKNIIKIL